MPVKPPSAFHDVLREQPLLRLLLANLLAGVAVSLLSVGGLIALNPTLRHLILADSSPVTAAALLLIGFTVTFCSCVMGAAVMGIGGDR